MSRRTAHRDIRLLHQTGVLEARWDRTRQAFVPVALEPFPMEEQENRTRQKYLEKLRRLCKFFRRNGLLAVYDLAEKEDDPFLSVCLFEFGEVAGCDNAQERLEQMFCAYLAAGNYRGGAFLNAVLVVKGLLLSFSLIFPSVRRFCGRRTRFLWLFRRCSQNRESSFLEAIPIRTCQVPFHAGDIVTVDCRHFAPVHHVVILEIGDNRDCCCLQALYHADDGIWDTGAVKHGYILPKHTLTGLSPLYRLSSFYGTLQGEERLLERVSRY